MPDKNKLNQSGRLINHLNITTAFFALFLATLVVPAAADEEYIFTPNHSAIHGFIRYTVLGIYHSRFQDFTGTIQCDPEKKAISSIVLKIKAESIKSDFPVNDRIVRSPQLLHVDKYPQIIFESNAVEKKSDGYYVTGLLTLHGVTKKINFPFSFEPPQTDETGRKFLKAMGKWVIHRKEFKIVWNKFLDYGGILVGNHITVDWEIKAFQK